MSEIGDKVNQAKGAVDASTAIAFMGEATDAELAVLASQSPGTLINLYSALNTWKAQNENANSATADPVLNRLDNYLLPLIEPFRQYQKQIAQKFATDNKDFIAQQLAEVKGLGDQTSQDRLRAIAGRYFQTAGMQPVPITFETSDDASDHGGCILTPETEALERIVIYKTGRDFASGNIQTIMNTVYQEIGDCIAHDLVGRYKKGQLPQNSPLYTSGAILAANIKGYIRPSSSFEGYKAQPFEQPGRDSAAVALNLLPATGNAGLTQTFNNESEGGFDLLGMLKPLLGDIPIIGTIIDFIQGIMNFFSNISGSLGGLFGGNDNEAQQQQNPAAGQNTQQTDPMALIQQMAQQYMQPQNGQQQQFKQNAGDVQGPANSGSMLQNLLGGTYVGEMFDIQPIPKVATAP